MALGKYDMLLFLSVCEFLGFICRRPTVDAALLTLLDKLWPSGQVILFVDGFAQWRYEQEMQGLNSHKETFRFVPHIVSGDFDSCSEEARNWFSEQGSQIVPTPDQVNVVLEINIADKYFVILHVLRC